MLALVWQRHTIPLSGELVLTDVHAHYDAASDRVTAVATGEAGVALKLDAPSAAANGSAPWTTLLDTSFPTYWYGCFVFDAQRYLLSGFIDGSGVAYGVVTFTTDGGATWANDTRIDVSAWGGGPIQFANASEGYMPSTSGASAWRTQTGGLSPSDWQEVYPSPGNWHSGDYIYDGTGRIVIAGSSYCQSSNYAITWSCRAPVDSSGIDTGIACDGTHCIIGGGEISPAVAGWAHVSSDGGSSWSGVRALSAPYPVRSVQAVNGVLLAAGGNFFSAVGGIFSSTDGGATWHNDIDIGQEVKACRALALPGRVRVYCVSAGQSGGSIYSTDVAA